MRLIAYLDYDLNSKLELSDKRVAARAIIFKDNKLLMIQSEKYKEFKFPGGGKLENETLIDTLIRETKEETGLIIKPNSIKPYGFTKELRKSNLSENKIFLMESYYYLCEVEKEIKETNLDLYEIEYGYQLKLVSIKDAIINNENLYSNFDYIPWIYREVVVLKDIEENFKKRGSYEII